MVSWSAEGGSWRMHGEGGTVRDSRRRGMTDWEGGSRRRC